MDLDDGAKIEQDDFLNRFAHTADLDQLLARLGVVSLDQGMSSERAAAVLERDGQNISTTPVKMPDSSVFFKSLFSGLSLLLWMGIGGCFLMNARSLLDGNGIKMEYVLTSVALGVAVVGGAVNSFVQELNIQAVRKNFAGVNSDDEQEEHEQEQEETTELKKKTKATCTVISVVRNGQETQLKSANLVVGDVVKVKKGDTLPADVRITKIEGTLRVDNSALNTHTDTDGSSNSDFVSIVTPSATADGNDDPASSNVRNILFHKTSVVEGECTGLVVRTGNRTFLSRQNHGNLDTKLKIIQMLTKFVHMWTRACFPGGTDNPYD